MLPTPQVVSKTGRPRQRLRIFTLVLGLCCLITSHLVVSLTKEVMDGTSNQAGCCTTNIAHKSSSAKHAIPLYTGASSSKSDPFIATLKTTTDSFSDSTTGMDKIRLAPGYGNGAFSAPASSCDVLYVVFCGGESGRADMNAILDTWGAKVRRGIILSNTPDDLPVDRIQATHGVWRILPSQSLEGGTDRDAKSSWHEFIQAVHDELERDPTIRWIVRSDSDTWWNVHGLQHLLVPEDQSRTARNGTSTKTRTTTPVPFLPWDEPLMMGEFFRLVNFTWVKGVSHKTFAGFDRSDGSNAYLTGGSGIVFTRTAMEQYHSCFVANTKLYHTMSSSNEEDTWFSRLAYQCHVTLARNGNMHQNPHNELPISETISVHRAVGDRRNGHRHPSYYERWIQQPLVGKKASRKRKSREHRYNRKKVAKGVRHATE